MQKLSSKKACQARNFFNDERKVSRLSRFISRRKLTDPSIVLGKNLGEKDIVFRLNVAGKKRALKINPDENISQWVSDSIRKQHDLAVKKGLIKPKHYSLQVLNFLASEKHASLMPIVKAFDANKLSFALKFGSKFGEIEEVSSFLKKHPWVNLEKFKSAYSELRDNLELLHSPNGIPTFDLSRSSNVFVVGANDKTKKLVFVLIDQSHPLDLAKTKERYSKRKD